MFKKWLAHPLTRGMNLDDPHTTALRRRIIREKAFLRRIYDDWYEQILKAIPTGPGLVLELGSGAGFLQERLPGIITSDVLLEQGVDVVLDATHLPIADSRLRAIVMVDVLHHVPDVRPFFKEAGRCVRSGGAIVMIEPWVTSWSKFIYGRFHHEPFEPEAARWEFPSAGPLTSANGALPWIVFKRDRGEFERGFPEWRIREIKAQMPFRYVVSGGVSMRSLMPVWSYPAWCAAENALQPWSSRLAMFARIILKRE